MNMLEFLTARIDDDETHAKYVLKYGDRGTNPNLGPARVVAECAVKRKLIDFEFDYVAGDDGEFGCCHTAQEIRAGECRLATLNDPICLPIIATLASLYAHHPDYRQEWRP